MARFTIAALSISTILIIGCSQGNKSNNQTQLEKTNVQQSTINQHPDEPERNDLIIYSGNCIQYRRDFVDSDKIEYTEVSRSFGKIVINSAAKKFTFFFGDKMVFTNDDYMSFIDDKQGGEGFTFVAGLSAFNQIAEKTFRIFDDAGTYGSNEPFIGYEYILTNYTIN